MNDFRYTRSRMPDPWEMSPRYTQPGRKWIAQQGPFKGQLGAEVCATRDFEWLACCSRAGRVARLQPGRPAAGRLR
jgi:hypothetical protein